MPQHALQLFGELAGGIGVLSPPPRLRHNPKAGICKVTTYKVYLCKSYGRAVGWERAMKIDQGSFCTRPLTVPLRCINMPHHQLHLLLFFKAKGCKNLTWSGRRKKERTIDHCLYCWFSMVECSLIELVQLQDAVLETIIAFH